MPVVPLPKGITGLDDFPGQKEYLTNLIYTDDGIIRSPGIDSLGTGLGVSRGAVRWFVNDIAYMVSGTRFISITSTGVVTNIGEIEGTADCFFSQGVVNLVIGVKAINGKGYRYNTTEGLVEITDSDYKPSVSADFIDGRHVFIPYDGSPAFYSDVDSAGSIEPLSFFDAEELPDLNKAAINISNQMYILGGESSEIFRTNVDPDNVFTRREGARVDVGFLGGLTRFGQSFAFLGRRRGESFQFFVMGSGDAIEISTPTIDEFINKEYTLEELKACEGFRYKHKGIEVLCFTLPRHTLSFANGNWFYSSSGVTLTNWRVKGICHAYGKYIVGDRNNSNIGTLSDGSQDYGSDVEFEISTYIRDERGSKFKIRKIEANMLTGKSTPAEKVSLSVSKDGLTYGDRHYRSLGETGNSKIRVKWQPPGGIGMFEHLAGIRIRSATNAKLSLDFLTSE